MFTPVPCGDGQGLQNLNHKFPLRTLSVGSAQANFPRGQLYKHLVVRAFSSGRRSPNAFFLRIQPTPCRGGACVP